MKKRCQYYHQNKAYLFTGPFNRQSIRPISQPCTSQYIGLSVRPRVDSSADRTISHKSIAISSYDHNEKCTEDLIVDQSMNVLGIGLWTGNHHSCNAIPWHCLPQYPQSVNKTRRTVTTMWRGKLQCTSTRPLNHRKPCHAFMQGIPNHVLSSFVCSFRFLKC